MKTTNTSNHLLIARFALALGIWAPLPAAAITIGPVDIEITEESLNLAGEGPIPLGSNYVLVDSKVTVKEHPAKLSTLQAFVTTNDLFFTTTIGELLTTPVVAFLSLESSLSIFPLIEVTDVDLVHDYAGSLGPTIILDPTDPLTAMSSDEISVDFSGVDLSGFDQADTILDLVVSGFNLATLSFISNNLAMSSDSLTFKQNLAQDVGGDSSEDDFIELTITGLSIDSSPFDINALLSIDFDSAFTFDFPTLTVNGNVADASMDPPFGPILLTPVGQQASVPEPGVLGLLSISLLAMAGFRGRRRRADSHSSASA
jgi:hypothetical protein